MAYEGLENNKNAEKWDIETATALLTDALELSYQKKYDFIGEIAQKFRIDKGTFDYIIDKFPELKSIKTHILANCETNCFRNSKKGKINIAVGIVNLKSNHGWTDRLDTTTKDKPLTNEIDYTKLSKQALKEIADATNNG